ncbi:MAG TPA: GlxA family transcriptional regulator [Methylomirabilota bacterium]|nr:GlxA family transcriptional regulator [Methylomirabilota bacterium]
MATFAPPASAESEVVRYGFLLLPEFPIYALIPAIEALRIANQNKGRRLYSWHLFSPDGRPVKAGNGMAIPVEGSIADVAWFPTVFVCAGNHPTQNFTKRVLNWLRRLARHGAVLGAIDTGVFALAEAGLLEGYRVTLHWEAMAMFRDQHPEIATTEQLYVIDRDRITCAGGAAALDLMLHLIARRHGPGLAQIVANGFVSQRIRRDAEPQRMSAQHISGDSRSPFTRILHEMEENLEAPLTARQLAKRAGISVRALGRILRDRVGESPMRYYLKVRLQAARNALFYSDIPIQDIAASCGFSCPEVFSRSFRAHFGLSPRDFRQQFTREQLRRFRPELDQQLVA